MNDVISEKYNVSIKQTPDGIYLEIAGIEPKIPLCIKGKDEKRSIHPETAEFMKYIQHKNGNKAPEYYITNGFVNANGLTKIGELVKNVLLEYDELKTYRVLVNGNLEMANKKNNIYDKPSNNVMALLGAIKRYHEKENLYPFSEEFDGKGLPTSDMKRSTVLDTIQKAESSKLIKREMNTSYSLTESGASTIASYLQEKVRKKQEKVLRDKRNTPKPQKHQPRDEKPHKKKTRGGKKSHWTNIQNSGITITTK
ncbi:MAG: hypothetical protein KAI53_04105 [Candidatus Aenigmarchaeota archaeon]|nr:hypothetical protein [Candidatus Aenigmarchaeota archaeon]